MTQLADSDRLYGSDSALKLIQEHTDLPKGWVFMDDLAIKADRKHCQ